MSNWVETLCAAEAAEATKKHHVASLSQALAQSLTRELETCIDVYNKHHLSHLPGAAAGVSTIPSSTGFQFSVKVHANPAHDLTIDFQINDAIVTAKGTGLPKHGVTYVIEPEIKDRHLVSSVEALHFVRGKQKHGVPELVQELLSPLLFPKLVSFIE